MGCGLSHNFTGKVAFVSGAASGIGYATALAFAEAGAWVAVSDINDDGGLRVVHEIQQAGGEALFFKCDIHEALSIKEMIDQIVRQMGRIDCAFNNAGIEGSSGDTVHCSEENFQKVLDVNLRGTWLCIKNQIPAMSKNGGGSIVNCASIAGLVGFKESPAYVASKHGIIGLTKTAALEYAQQKIRVNAICPGVIETPMVRRFTHDDKLIVEQLESAAPMKRLGRPEEIAMAVLWLCSEQSSFVTGHSLVVDGGWTAQ